MALSRVSVRLFAVAVCLAAASLVTAAQRGGGGAATPPPLPVTASSLAAHPASYAGKTVTMTGAVAQQLSPTIFTVDQGQATALPLPILVVAPALTAPAASRSYVTVIGAAVQFDPGNLGALKGYALDIPADVAEKFRGHPAVFATAVVTPDLMDLTKPKPVPLTPEEQALSALMKKVSPAATALRTSVSGSNAAAAHDRAVELKGLFADVQAFFKKRGTADAEGWAGEALKLADAVDTAAAASKWPEATTAATSLNQLCTTCHSAHRERLEDGTYRIKGSR